MINVGLETVSWGQRFGDVTSLAAAASSAGYAGLEIAQHVGSLGPPSSLAKILSRNNICPVSLSTGSIHARIQYCAELGTPYVYTEDLSEDVLDLAASFGQTLGLHPHVYKDIETIDDAQPYLEKNPHLGLVLDVAHIFLAGCDVVQAIERGWSRLLAVHMKDWTGHFGTYPMRFAEGFAALGDGDLGGVLDQVARMLVARRFAGWVIVEQNVAHSDPLKCAVHSRNWLRERGL